MNRLLRARRCSRREILRAGVLLAPAALLPWPVAAAQELAQAGGTTLGFKGIAGSRADMVRVPPGYRSSVLLRWGDALWPDVPRMDSRRLRRGSLLAPGAAERQARQFGYNCDALAFFPLDGAGQRGLLCVNHEYTNPELMFPGRRPRGSDDARTLADWQRRNPQGAPLELAAHGISIVELRLTGGEWRVERSSPYTRRVTGSTPLQIEGPAAGHTLLRTFADPDGRRVLGTLGNCAGGKTPWGSYLTAEENIDDYFGGYRSWLDSGRADPRAAAAHRRFPLLEASYHGWEHVEPRFDVRGEPNEALRFGWIVEFDPRDPREPGRKRTALGRFCHEGATCTLARDGRVVVYMGDDERFEYLYKYVSRGRFDPARPDGNRALLDEGTLYVAVFDEGGGGEWRPLVHDPRGPLNARAGFADQAEVLVKARAAADLLDATPMDRPEDVAVDPRSGRVYVAFTKNPERTPRSERREFYGREVDTGVDAANPRANNVHGHILEFDEQDGDAAALRFRWDVLVLAGDGPVPFACPDNLEVDARGHLWIVTDGEQPRGDNDGCFVLPTSGPERGEVRQFMSAPREAEVCGLEFTPDGETLFLSIQHPGESGSFDRPRSDWPDGNGAPPRPSVIAVRREGGGRIGD